MGKADTPDQHGTATKAETTSFPPSAGRQAAAAVSFDRHELSHILNLYGRMVAKGEWRDYAIDFNRHTAMFSVFRRACELPLYRIVKDPSLARRQGAYAVLATTGQVLKRGHDLTQVLRAIDKPLALVQ